MTRLRSLSLAAAFVTISLSAQAKKFLNQPSPALQLSDTLQVDAARTTATGKFIVLEFWATWCTPCIANLPHLNAVSEQFKNEFQFISITSEPREKVISFLKKRRINGWVGIDSGETAKNFEVASLPQTFIISPDNHVVFEGRPESLTPELLRSLMAGNNAVKPEQAEAPQKKLGSWSGGEDPVITANFDMKRMAYLHQEVIRKSVFDEMAGSGYSEQPDGAVGITLLGHNIREAVAFTSEKASSFRVVNYSSVKEAERWDIIFSRHRGSDLSKGMKELEMLICRTFSINIRDSIMQCEALIPDLKGCAKLLVGQEKQSDPAYKSLQEIFNALEAKVGKIVAAGVNADEIYLDVFELGQQYYGMNGSELKAWLEKQGIVFKNGRAAVAMRALNDI